ncbi:MAG: hypothetical protein A2Z14_13165 [Chloroflexi bacterium RBG_16_48_8]|nr:MAG: hypothetical protein A2Z14_13165 [Chloroflexi bacterium RBG_16_48_8]
MRILDIGCGNRTYLRVAAEANPQVNGLGFEVNEKVAQETKQNLEEWGMNDKMRVIVRDIQNPSADPGGEFDLIGLYNVIYYFEVEERLLLFPRLRSMLSDCGLFGSHNECAVGREGFILGKLESSDKFHGGL